MKTLGGHDHGQTTRAVVGQTEAVSSWERLASIRLQLEMSTKMTPSNKWALTLPTIEGRSGNNVSPASVSSMMIARQPPARRRPLIVRSGPMRLQEFRAVGPQSHFL